MGESVTEPKKKTTSHLTELGDGQNWDPAPNERAYYRSVGNGDRGYLVRRNGIDSVKLDRPMQDIVRPFKEHEWAPEKEQRPLNPIEKARIAYAADQELCRAIGLIRGSRKTWLDISDDMRIQWTNDGPERPEIRVKLFAMIMECLKAV